MSTSREKRCVPQPLQIYNIKISKDGKFIINGKTRFADDVVGIIRDVYVYYKDNFGEKYNKEAIEKLQEVIRIMDQRAEERHGYSGSEEEKSFVPWYKLVGMAIISAMTYLYQIPFPFPIPMVMADTVQVQQ